jgi:hypothetical protein
MARSHWVGLDGVSRRFNEGPSAKVSEPRETGIDIRTVGATVHLKPASPAACHVFPSP